MQEQISTSVIGDKLIEYLILIITQILFAYFRVWNIKEVAKGRKLLAHLSWQLYGVVYLISLTIGIKSVIEYDYIGIAVWFISSGIGLELSMRIK